ncbi:hypothetical protein B0O99DRAFT_401075 [Bisporella sp. PMI_857]|nr:hypothetical protein B0O99DRAFT_401075 [Bisporella sp. PMI_857]
MSANSFHAAEVRKAVRKFSHRRPHHKSRNGCTFCKHRKIKCDEQRPECFNCVAKSLSCSFKATPTSTASISLSTPIAPTETGSPSTIFSTQSVSQSPLQNIEHHSLNVADLELLHVYDTSTSYTLGNVPGYQSFLRIHVPRMAFSHNFLLHSILAISALHLSFLRKDLQPLYMSRATYHQNAALRIATPLLNNSGCDYKTIGPPLYMLSNICTFFTLGIGPQTGDFLLFGDKGISQWLVIFRGARSILESSNYALLKHSDLSPMFSLFVPREMQPTNNMRNKNIEDLRKMIVEEAHDHPNYPIYMEALETLSKSFLPATMTTAGTYQVPFQSIFAWLYLLSDDFVLCLIQREPIALVILAHFCVLLNSISSFWWMQGWVHHLISEIYNSLDPVYLIWIGWPLEQVGWIP